MSQTKTVLQEKDLQIERWSQALCGFQRPQGSNPQPSAAKSRQLEGRTTKARTLTSAEETCQLRTAQQRAGDVKCAVKFRKNRTENENLRVQRQSQASSEGPPGKSREMLRKRQNNTVRRLQNAAHATNCTCGYSAGISATGLDANPDQNNKATCSRLSSKKRGY